MADDKEHPMSALPDSTPRIGVTGHRARDFNRDTARWAQTELHRVFTRLRDEHDAMQLNCGMANGTDLWAAVAALDLDLELDAYLPFEAEYQNARWNATERAMHLRLLGHAGNAFVSGTLPVHPDGMSPADKGRATRAAMLALYHARNTELVNHSDVIVAVWSGRRHGGTYHALTEAASIQLPVIVLNPRTLRTVAMSGVQFAERVGQPQALASVA